MASIRVAGPTCLFGAHPGVDDGTLCRNLSALPGTLSTLIHETTTMIGEAAEWSLDTALLYKELNDQGLDFLIDVYFGEKGSGALPIAQSFDNRINVLGLLHNAFSRKHKTGAMLPFNELAKWFAADDPIKRLCLEHYIDQQGADLKLSRAQLILMPTYIDVFQTDAYAPNMKPFIEEAKKGRTVKLATTVQGQNDALGNFVVNVNGEIKPASGTPSGPTDNPYAKNRMKAADPGAPLMFEGTMDWHDKWDFDSKVADRISGKNVGRPRQAEIAVAAVAALVDGVPFEVTSEAVKVTQYSGRFPVY